jgi:hypothetical protein
MPYKDLIDLKQKGNTMCVYAEGTDWLLGKLKGKGPWFTYTTQEWSNEEQCFKPIPKVTHTWTLKDIRKYYNNRMIEHFVHCQ